jgi:serine/threonine protein kinase
MTRMCPLCGSPNRPNARFCQHCGSALDQTASGASTPPAHATGRLAPNTLLHHRYLILRKVGEGGMGAVYQATDTQNHRLCAIKEMSQDGLSPEELAHALQSFQFEAATLARLNHPNLPKVYEQFSEQNRHYLVMDYIDGETLEDRLARIGQPLPESEVLGYAKQLCSVLEYLHSQHPPIIFRDLKPGNIMVTRDNQIKLIDFGIARVFRSAKTHDTQILGTPGFAPPEQYGRAQTDARSDLYALGVTLYQLLTHYDPSTTPFQLPPLRSLNPNVSPQVEAAITRATALQREDRPASVAEFRRELFGPPSTTPQTARPVLQTQPAALHFGAVPAGQSRILSLTIKSSEDHEIKVRPLVPWLSLDRHHIRGKSATLQVILSPERVSGSNPHSGSIEVSLGRQKLLVPVTVQILGNPATATPPHQAIAYSKFALPGRESEFAREATAALTAFSIPATALALLDKFAFWPGLAPPMSSLPMVALLIGTVPVALAGALLGRWQGNVASRALTGLIAGSLLLGLTLLLWLGWITPTFLGDRSSPLALLLAAMVAASIGVAAGSAPSNNKRLLHLMAVIRRWLRPLLFITIVLTGMSIGASLPAHFGLGFLSLLGSLLGLICAIPLAWRLDRWLKRRQAFHPLRYP